MSDEIRVEYQEICSNSEWCIVKIIPYAEDSYGVSILSKEPESRKNSKKSPKIHPRSTSNKSKIKIGREINLPEKNSDRSHHPIAEYPTEKRRTNLSTRRLTRRGSLALPPRERPEISDKDRSIKIQSLLASISES